MWGANSYAANTDIVHRSNYRSGGRARGWAIREGSESVVRCSSEGAYANNRIERRIQTVPAVA